MDRKFEHRKSLGQNFLNNAEVLRRTLMAGDLSEDDVVLEIGSGQGVLTRQILQSPVSFVHALEIDRRLAPWLLPLQELHPGRFTIHWDDALRSDFAAFSPQPNKVIANIPYNITSNLFWKILTELAPAGLVKMVMLIQKEAAERLTAPSSAKERGPLGVTLELMGYTKTIMKVSPGSFTPPPRVWSELICFELRQNHNLAADPEWRRFISACFGQRRKKLINNLKLLGLETGKLTCIFNNLGISPAVRAEELSAELCLNLFNSFMKESPAEEFKSD